MAKIYFDTFKDTIERAKKGNYLTTEARLILWGRLAEACARRDLTVEEFEQLEAMLEIDRQRYLRDMDVATIGEPEEDEEYA